MKCSVRVLVLLVLCLWDRFHEAAGQYCVDQPKRMDSFVGGVITILCQFSFPVTEDTVRHVYISVKAAKEKYCGRDKDEIYNSTEDSITHPSYQGRLKVNLDVEHRNATITINNVTLADATCYCCHFKITFEGSMKVKEWQTGEGTKFFVKGVNKPRLETVPVIFAAPGENVTLLSHIRSQNGNTLPNITTCHIITNIVTQNIRSCLVENNILSFRINQVKRSDQGSYWWNISEKKRSSWTFSYHLGPELQILDKSDSININQTEEVEFYGSTIISCNFTVKEKSNILRTEVYWMIGDPRESYVYHPNLDYIHPDYKGKTRLMDGSNLLLTDFNGPNNNVFYCRVIIRQCQEGDNEIETLLGDGAGTHLIIKGNPSSILTIALCMVLPFLVACISLVICLVKRKGNKLQNSREQVVELNLEAENQQSNEMLKSPEINLQAEDLLLQVENPVYSTVNHFLSAAPKKTETPMGPDIDIVYADVKKN